MATAGALANLDIDATLDRVRAGVLMPTLAAEYGVCKEAIRKRLLQHPDYEQAIRDQAGALVEVATAQCFDESLAPKQVGIARVRLEAAHKWAAARDPDRWAPQTRVTLDVGPVLADRLARSEARVIESSAALPVIDVSSEGA